LFEFYNYLMEVNMKRSVKLFLGLLLVFTFTSAITVMGQAPACDYYGTQTSGAEYCIDVPPDWNGVLVIFAHGYVAASEPVGIPWDQLFLKLTPDGEETVYMPDLITQQGFAFATTSYSVNGLAVKEGVADVVDLVNVFSLKVGPPAAVFLVGASEGGLVTTLAIEQHPEFFTGGLAMCGPIGSFTGQINYWGDFRVVFDYFMDAPDFDVLPGNAVHIPAVLMNKWDQKFVPRIGDVLAANPVNTPQLMNVTQAPFDPLYPTTIGESALSILWYNVFATEDAIDKLGGRPFDNFERVYTGSFDDEALNAGVKRFKAQPAALEEIASNYETSGVLLRPLVTMHTTGDPVVPYWHQEIYWDKVANKNPYYPDLSIMINRYGHCSFTADEVLGAFFFLTSLP
jgi:pimeloyl-ACP methyl ester carboxylesterase